MNDFSENRSLGFDSSAGPSIPGPCLSLAPPSYLSAGQSAPSRRRYIRKGVRPQERLPKTGPVHPLPHRLRKTNLVFGVLVGQCLLPVTDPVPPSGARVAADQLLPVPRTQRVTYTGMMGPQIPGVSSTRDFNQSGHAPVSGSRLLLVACLPGSASCI